MEGGSIFDLRMNDVQVSTANRARPDDCVIAAYLMLQGQIDPMDLHRLESSTDVRFLFRKVLLKISYIFGKLRFI